MNYKQIRDEAIAELKKHDAEHAEWLDTRNKIHDDDSHIGNLAIQELHRHKSPKAEKLHDQWRELDIADGNCDSFEDVGNKDEIVSINIANGFYYVFCAEKSTGTTMGGYAVLDYDDAVKLADNLAAENPEIYYYIMESGFDADQIRADFDGGGGDGGILYNTNGVEITASSIRGEGKLIADKDDGPMHSVVLEARAPNDDEVGGELPVVQGIPHQWWRLVNDDGDNADEINAADCRIIAKSLIEKGWLPYYSAKKKGGEYGDDQPVIA